MDASDDEVVGSYEVEYEYDEEEGADEEEVKETDDVLIWKDWMVWTGDERPTSAAEQDGSWSAQTVSQAAAEAVAAAAPSASDAAALANDAVEEFRGRIVKRVEAFGDDTLALRPRQLIAPQTVWDLRAGLEKRRRQEQARTAWLERKQRTLGRYPCQAADWRSDVRVRDTGNPTAPEYREWTVREIWDMILMDGRAADPRDLVSHRVHEPGERVDFVAQGYQATPEIDAWLAAQGRLIEDDEVDEVADRDAELALLASEFSDFDDFAAGSSSDASAEPDDGFAGQF